MKRKIALFGLLLMMASLFVLAQTKLAAKNGYDWPNVSETGQLGQYLDLHFYDNPAPVYSIDWSVSGTAPTVCTFRVEGSSDGISWVGLDATAPAADSVPCTSTNMISIAYKPVRMLRINIVSYTAGDGTTSVKFRYTAGR